MINEWSETDVKLEDQPAFQATISMQITGHARDRHEFQEKMHSLVAEGAIGPFVQNGQLHGSLDQFAVALIRPMNGERRDHEGATGLAHIQLAVHAGTMDEVECVAREASAVLYDYGMRNGGFEQGKITETRIVLVEPITP